MTAAITQGIYHVVSCAWSLGIAAGLRYILGMREGRRICVYFLGNVLSFVVLYILPVTLGVADFPVPYLYTYVSRAAALCPWAFCCLEGSHVEQLCYILFYIAFFKTFAIVLSPFYEAFGTFSWKIYFALDYASYFLQGILLWMFTLFLKKHLLVIPKLLQKKIWAMMLYCPVSFIFILEIANPQNRIPVGIMYAIFAVLLMLNIPIIYYLFAEIADNYEQSLRLRQALTDTKAQLSEFRYSVDLRECLREERHELKHRYFYIQMLLREGRRQELEEYLERQTSQRLDLQPEIVTGNRLMDYVLNTKLTEAGKWKIPLKVDALIPGNLSLDDEVLCTILLNLLDNAVEAGSREQDPDIRVVLKCVNDYLVVKIGNRVSENILEKNPYLKTTKEPSGRHGHGIRIVKDLVKKQEGLYEIFMDGNYFVVTVMLPLDQPRQPGPVPPAAPPTAQAPDGTYKRLP